MGIWNTTGTEELDPFYDEVAAFGGKRLESGAAEARALLLAVPVCVLGGDPVDAMSNPVGPCFERVYNVLLRRADWLDHKPPQAGDSVSVSGYPVLKVSAVLSDADGWNLTCHAKEAVS